MKIILLKDIAKVGKKYETKDISDGYAVNLLIPRGFAIPATADAIKRIGMEKMKVEGERKVHEELLLKNLSELDGVTITIKGKANEKGHLFAGLHKEAIADEVLKQTRLQIDPLSIQLEHPVKEIGTHTIEVNGGGKKVKFTLEIEAR